MSATSTVDLYLRWSAWRGLYERVGDPGVEYRQRLHYELDVLTSCQFSSYFLVVADIIATAKARGIRIGPGRGSAGGSLVAYCLGITDIDPLPSKLLFERFLNPERSGLPDIDVDAAEDRRDELLNIIVERYGEECVANLGTFGTVGAKAALKDSARVLGYSYRDGEERTWNLPRPKFGRAPTLAEYDGDRDDEIYQLAVGFEGKIRSESVHAAGVVISPEPLADVVPLRRQGGKGMNVIAFDMNEVEQLGLIKFDFLALRQLKIIDDAINLINREGR